MLPVFGGISGWYNTTSNMNARSRGLNELTGDPNKPDRDLDLVLPPRLRFAPDPSKR